MTALKRNPVALLVLAVAISGCGDSSKAPQDSAAQSGASPSAPGFAENMPDALRTVAMVAGGKCNLERVNGQMFGNDRIAVPRAGELTFDGWIINQSGTVAMERVWIRASVGTKWLYSSTESGLKRPDIVTAYKSPTYEASGFRVVMDASKQPAGDYYLALVGLSKGTAYLCENGRRISLK